eukprot:987910-Rhodomonas_salina.1
MLTGEAKDKAWKEGRCIWCGSPNHMIRNCTNSGEKKKLKNFDRKLAKKPAANPPMSKDKKNRKFKKMEKAKKEEEDSETST